MGTIYGGGIKYNMIMNVRFIYMRTYHKSVIALRPPHSCFCQAKNGPVIIIEKSSTKRSPICYTGGGIRNSYAPIDKLPFGVFKPSDGFLKSAAFFA